MEVQKYLANSSIKDLMDNYSIVVTYYPDRVVLNYNQIESPRFNAICDECRALILRKDTWEVMARSFDRFYNLNEGVENTSEKLFAAMANNKSYIETKLDGSIISFYHDGQNWCQSTRKLAFAEGKVVTGRVFSSLFEIAAKKTDLYNVLSEEMKAYTYIFELTSPENRVVTRYSDTRITLIGGRHNASGKELTKDELDSFASLAKIDRPKTYQCSSAEELLALVSSFPVLDEGVVIRVEFDDGTVWRVKCKNPKYVSISHMRENGSISAKNVLNIVMANEQTEYLSYFPEDTRYFTYVSDIYKELIARINEIYEKHKSIVVQKDFAIAIMAENGYSIEKGILFSIRKSGKSTEELLKEMGAKKLCEGIGLKEKFLKLFDIEEGMV
jgi:hypothetical protein